MHVWSYLLFQVVLLISPLRSSLSSEEKHFCRLTLFSIVVSVTPRPRLTREEGTPGIHCIGGWVGLRAGLNTKATPIIQMHGMMLRRRGTNRRHDLANTNKIMQQVTPVWPCLTVVIDMQATGTSPCPCHVMYEMHEKRSVYCSYLTHSCRLPVRVLKGIQGWPITTRTKVSNLPFIVSWAILLLWVATLWQLTPRSTVHL
jgi:hypothetical protein